LSELKQEGSPSETRIKELENLLKWVWFRSTDKLIKETIERKLAIEGKGIE